MTDIACREPFDLGLSLRAMRSFGTGAVDEMLLPVLRLGVWLEGRPTLVEARQVSFDPAVVRASASPPAAEQALRDLAERVVNAAMDLGSFYQLVAEHEVLGPLTGELRGLKPFRPADLFDMMVMAITEQQISLVASQHIQARLVQRFGGEIEGMPVFPRPEALAEASLDALTACGLSRRKAEYVSGVAREVAAGALDLGTLETASNDEVRSRIVALRGFGLWSADYILVRGLGRVDGAPVDDLGIRRVLGDMLGDGRLLTPAEAGTALAPFAPYQGLAVFYLLVASRPAFRRP
jgi:DNA-3-methyladenine glycosylase II